MQTELVALTTHHRIWAIAKHFHKTVGAETRLLAAYRRERVGYVLSVLGLTFPDRDLRW